MAAQPTMLSITCAQCGTDAQRPYRGSGVKPTLCGNACKVAAYRDRRPERVSISRERERHLSEIADRARVRVTVWRNRPTVPTWQERYEEERAARAEGMAQTPCSICAQPVDYTGTGRPRQFCSSECKAVSPAHLRGKRTAKARRRALERGVEAERFDPLEVLMRDGWRCHICRVKTPKHLRGTYDDRAPELDHIIPLAEGGKHTRLNTACSCRKCNGAKGAKPLGQMRLVA